ncbi:MAG: BrnT family toxin [Acidobacteria bacterium]|nr:BrnT family toxin [Acidobacteriota bacterium]
MGDLEDLVAGLEGFEWDGGNSAKNWLRHEVQQAEAEQTLLNTPLVVNVTTRHGAGEPRFIALGQTDVGRLLTIVFTIRGTRLRVISARAMSKPERKIDGQAQASPEGDPDVHE